MEDEIEKGDIVHVNINSAQVTLHHRAEVLNVPSNTGESWIFKDYNNGRIRYISEGCTISLIRKAELELKLKSKNSVDKDLN